MSLDIRKLTQALIYCRVSTNKQEDEGSSLESQEEICRAYCLKHGYYVLDVLKETHSGIELDERELMTDIRVRMRRRSFDVLVIYKFDRLSRDQTHQAVILYEAKKRGIRVESTIESFDDSPLGNFMRSVIGFAAALEHENIKVRTYTGRVKRVERGNFYVGARPAYGYQFNDTRTGYVIDEKTAPIARRIFEELAVGHGVRGVSRRLNADNIPPPSGKNGWYASTIKVIVNNPLYYGEARAFRTKWEKVQRLDKKTGEIRTVNHVTKQEGILLPANVVPAIIPRELAEKAISNLSTLRRHNINRNPEQYLLREGYVRCGICGLAMTCHLIKERPYYECPNHPKAGIPHHYIAISAHVLDGRIWAEVLNILGDPIALQNRLENYLAIERIDGVDLLKEQIADIQAQQKRAAESLVRISDEEAAAPLEVVLNSLGEKIKNLKKRLEITEHNRLQQERIEAAIRRLAAWGQAVAEHKDINYDDRRLVLQALGIIVTVQKGNVRKGARWEWQMLPFQANPNNSDTVYIRSNM